MFIYVLYSDDAAESNPNPQHQLPQPLTAELQPGGAGLGLDAAHQPGQGAAGTGADAAAQGETESTKESSTTLATGAGSVRSYFVESSADHKGC